MMMRFGSEQEAHSAHQSIGGDHANDYDALADLFLSDEDFAGDDVPRPAPAPPVDHPHLDDAAETPAAPATNDPAVVVEALLFGHMPPMAGAWASQYAARVASELGEPVAFIRLHAGHAAVQVFGLPTGARHEPTGDLALAVRRACATCRRLIVRVDETDEPLLAHCRGISRVTLLAGADQAATVAAYRTIKALAGAIDERGESVGIHVAFTGVDRAKAAEAFEKLSTAASTFLETPLTLEPGVARLSPVMGAALHRGETATDAATLLRLVCDVAGCEGLGVLAPPEPIMPAAPAPEADARADLSAPFVRARNAEPHAAAPASHVPAPRRASTATRICADSGPLALRLRGLTPTDLRCPLAPGVEIALDDEGVLHLLVDRRTRGAIKCLLSVRDWAGAHTSLLAAACKGEGLPALRDDAPPKLHLFTDAAPKVRPLIDGDIRLHLLAPVRLDGRDAWACADLN
ncbi:MAG: hypothetical protein EA379_11120 [Phycisphaerales bacterium]|nr:MAG: hypothetical protein EA379_11120 [Phycisphaerales bacterium]